MRSELQLIYLCEAPELDRMPAGVNRSESTTVVLNVESCHTKTELLDAIGDAFQFPYAAAGFDAALDLMADLDWMSSRSGYVVLVEGIDELMSHDAALGGQLLALCPYLCDRWRLRHIPFRVVLAASRPLQPAVRAELDRANEALAAAASRPWVAHIGPIPIESC